MFLTVEDFNTLPYNLPDLSDLEEQFSTLFIPAQEEEALREVLGSVLYQEFIEGLFTGGDPTKPIAEGAILQKWKDLRDGADYNLDGKLYKYLGVKKFLKPFVYAMWTRHTFYFQGGAGISLPQSENGTFVHPGQQVSLAYNDFSKQVGNDCETQRSLYGFLLVNKEVYINWDFTDPGKMNDFNI